MSGINPRAKKHWRRLILSDNVMLERLGRPDIPGDGDFFHVFQKVEVTAFKARPIPHTWFAPINGQTWVAGFRDIFEVRSKLVETTHEIADENNTMLFTCHECGAWLKHGDDGYGTMNGWCGCSDGTNEAEAIYS